MPYIYHALILTDFRVGWWIETKSVLRRSGLVVVPAHDQSLPRIIQCYRYHKFGGSLFSRTARATLGMILINYRA